MRVRLAVPFVRFFAVLLGALLPDVAQAPRSRRPEHLERAASGLAVGKALVTYHARGRLQRVLAWGAVNARRPIETEKQAAFGMDYSGGWGTFGRYVWKTLRNARGRYSGPALPWLVTACTRRTAPTGWSSGGGGTMDRYGLPRAAIATALPGETRHARLARITDDPRRGRPFRASCRGSAVS